MKTWTRFPFVRLVLPLIVGIVVHKLLGFWLNVPIWVVFLPILFLPINRFLAVKSAYSGRWIYGLALNLFLILAGFQLSALHKGINHRNHFSSLADGNVRQVFSGIIDNEPTERASSFRFTLKVDLLKNNDALQKVSGNIMAYVAKDSTAKTLHYGDRVIFSEPPLLVPGPGNPGEFNYAAYLANKGIYHQVFLRGGRYGIEHDAGGNMLQAFAYNLRKGFLQLFKNSGIDGQEYAVAAALMIGYGDLLDPDQRKEFSGAGAMHILCVSGLHVGIIFLLADKLFFFLRKRKQGKWLRPVLILLVIWFYALITGLAPSVMRASLMFSLVTIGGALNRKSHILNSIAASAFLLMLFRPSILFELGFQLSYVAVIGIVLLQPHLQKMFLPSNKFQKYLWDIITVSLAAQIATGPISLMYFHQFPNYFLITNLLVIPMAGVLIYSGLAFIVLTQIPFIGSLASTILIWELKFLNFTVGFIEGLPGAVSRSIYLPGFSTFLIYMIILIIFGWVLLKKNIWFRMGVALLVFFIATIGYINVERIKCHELIFHNIRSHTAIGLVENRQHLLFADSALIAGTEKLSYPLEGYRIENGLQEMKLVDISSTIRESGPVIVYKGFVAVGGKKIALVADKNNLPETGKQIKVDFVVLRSNAWVKASEMVAAFPGATFVIDASNSQRRTKQWMEDFTQLNANVYSIAEKGALVVKL
jgi:competence protein ComEC